LKVAIIDNLTPELVAMRGRMGDIKPVWRAIAPLMDNPSTYVRADRLTQNYREHLRLRIRKRQLFVDSTRPFVPIPAPSFDDKVALAVLDHAVADTPTTVVK
jgi:hypothetical protein